MSIELENNCVKINHQVIVNPCQNLTAICLPFQPHLHDCHVVQTMSFKMHHPGLSNQMLLRGRLFTMHQNWNNVGK